MDERLKLYRQGLTDAEIAERLGVTKGAIASWRSRHGLPSNRRENMLHARYMAPPKLTRRGFAVFRIPEPMVAELARLDRVKVKLEGRRLVIEPPNEVEA